jgi:hypothetical protein
MKINILFFIFLSSSEKIPRYFAKAHGSTQAATTAMRKNVTNEHGLIDKHGE